MSELNNLFDIYWYLTPVTACDSSPGVLRILTAGQRTRHFQNSQNEKERVSGEAVLLFQLA